MPASSSAGTAHFRAGRVGEAWVLAGQQGQPAREVLVHSRAREVLAHSLVPEHKVAVAAEEDKRAAPAEDRLAVLVAQPAGGNRKAG